MPPITLAEVLSNVGTIGAEYTAYIVVGVSIALAPVLIRTGLKFFRRGK